MSFTSEWLISQRVVLVKFSGDLQMHDLEANDADMYAYVSAGAAPVHIICDVEQVTTFPKSIRTIAQSANRYLNHPNMGWFMVVGVSNPMLGFISSMVSQLTRLNLRQAQSVTEALDRLSRVDHTLGLSQQR